VTELGDKQPGDRRETGDGERPETRGLDGKLPLLDVTDRGGIPSVYSLRRLESVMSPSFGLFEATHEQYSIRNIFRTDMDAVKSW
jgi:hypothetical protein